MGTIIFYYSGSGNSLQIAKVIAKEIENSIIKPLCDTSDIIKVDYSTKSIGFVFPVFNFGMPRIVKRFVEKLEIQPGIYLFAFICYGGYGANTLGMLDDLLHSKGLKLSYAEGVVMPKSNASAPMSETIKKIIDKSISKVKLCINDISHEIQRPIKRRAKLLTKIANNRLYKNIEEFDNKFWVTQSCTNCGTCEKICPVSNIKIEDKIPLWLHKCEQCLRCLQWCPGEAIQYGKRTATWRRYHNPYIKVADLMTKNIKGV
jgi:ferredoxin